MAGKLMGSLQTDLSTRVYRITSGFNEGLYLVANEPSLGMYRLQEHIQANVPKIVEQRQILQQVCQQVDGACYDLSYDTQTVQSMSKVSRFPSISAKLLQAVELKAQLDSVEPHSTASKASPHLTHTPASTNAQYQTPPTSINTDTSELKPKRFD